MKKKSKGGKRPGAGRPPLSDAKENVPLRVAKSDIKKWGGKEELKKKLYDFIAFPYQFDSVSVVNFPIPSPKGQKPKDDLRLSNLIQFTEKPPDEAYDALPLPINVNDDPLRKMEIQRQIESIRAEKIPKERDTVFGRKSWALEQKKRIEDLEKQIKQA